MVYVVVLVLFGSGVCNGAVFVTVIVLVVVVLGVVVLVVVVTEASVVAVGFNMQSVNTVMQFLSFLDAER